MKALTSTLSSKDFLSILEQTLELKSTSLSCTLSSFPIFLALLLKSNLENKQTTWVEYAHITLLRRCQNELAQFGIAVQFLSRDRDSKSYGENPINSQQEISIFEQLLSENPIAIVLEEASFNIGAPDKNPLTDAFLTIKTGSTLERETIISTLENQGYERSSHVFEQYQYSTRGSILDIYSLNHENPIRIEFFGDEIDSIRSFDPISQRKLQTYDSLNLLFETPESNSTQVKDYLKKTDSILSLRLDERSNEVTIEAKVGLNKPIKKPNYLSILDSPLGTYNPGEILSSETALATLDKQIESWNNNNWSIYMIFNASGEISRFDDITNKKYIKQKIVTPVLAELPHSFSITDHKVAVISSSEIFGKSHLYKSKRRLGKSSNPINRQQIFSESNLKPNDIIVHANHGVGRLIKITNATISGGHENEKVLEIEYAEDSRLYVPIEQSHLISRYIGPNQSSPKLSKLGGTSWAKTKEKATKSVQDYASKLLATQAKRKTAKGYSHPPDGQWQKEFEDSFPYKETPDQLKAINETKADMESFEAMDRLICGDVGFGKTEIAIRAAFKSAIGGRQVAMLAPTTVLAQQHYENLSERYSDWPISIGLLSRFATKSQQKETLKGLAEGSIDIVVGTHRILSKDVSFKNLGLAIIDEEQRFGVSHKERFKEIFQLIDVLTLSATPIPRTLYLSLMGVRNLSIIETPPVNRKSVETKIIEHNEKQITQAIQQELNRGGQVFYLHNRVNDIYELAKKIQLSLPDQYKIAVGHGQMHERDLEKVMHDFIEGVSDILVCTTIIESGIDIPNANTIIIHRADHFGLADLYQLRGRVGRSERKAYAYLILDKNTQSTADAKKRINAIKRYNALGSGFQIAMRDLEIRGAGNLLGSKQSGNIAAVGFDLYCQLLRQSVARISGKKIPTRVETSFKADFVSFTESEWIIEGNSTDCPAYLPKNWLIDTQTRMSCYRQLAEITKISEINELGKEWKDRFGTLPSSAENLLLITKAKTIGHHKKISSIQIKDGKLILTRNQRGIQIQGKYPKLKTTNGTQAIHETIELLEKL